MARERISDLFSAFCIWVVIPLLAASLLFLLVQSGNPLLLVIFPLLAVVFFITKQLN
ncbi:MULTISPECIES: hypothetical protein [Pelosinus]|jgi:hypothetical protein|uniref:Uncharacterized protein n=1 Tax=Pelosinus fermentans B4 TaxID=1149862 RepID=I8RIU9_9FIRM|nr:MULTISPECIES: hypothetical protein [Pelosinus]EIW19828.1 hypothetical protein FB4_0079 [Pelosinus fermentans B4]EIW21315.1 hypothetical protein FA11_1042 [Pelosinus fermentans A11]OAM94982.1 hypothetical protein FR7_03003 [Pelosinus fermentans DSM 17108]SDR21514.1 hypothetical protein SAMN04515679_3134 [Pelosinus fermentans]